MGCQRSERLVVGSSLCVGTCHARAVALLEADQAAHDAHAAADLAALVDAVATKDKLPTVVEAQVERAVLQRRSDDVDGLGLLDPRQEVKVRKGRGRAQKAMEGRGSFTCLIHARKYSKLPSTSVRYAMWSVGCGCSSKSSGSWPPSIRYRKPPDLIESCGPGIVPALGICSSHGVHHASAGSFAW